MTEEIFAFFMRTSAEYFFVNMSDEDLKRIFGDQLDRDDLVYIYNNPDYSKVQLNRRIQDLLDSWEELNAKLDPKA